ncbi:MAG: hypothetical protein NTY35_02900 [Planctomycetota bacterium]|nr:hypothetical protein [Planctomycetota bacterium]
MLTAIVAAALLQALWLEPPASVPLDREDLDGFAYDIAGAPDLDGDAFEDLLVADPDPRLDADARGGFWVVSGRTGARIAHVEGPAGRGWFGVSVGWLGTRSAGEKPAFAVGDVASYPIDSLFEDRNQGQTGVVHLVTIDGEELGRIANDPPRKRFGRSIVATADLDGDGARDLVLPVGSPKPDGVLGSIRVRSGRSLREIHPIAAAVPSIDFESNVVVTSNAIPDFGHLLACASAHDGIFLRRTVQLHRLAAKTSLHLQIEGRQGEADFGDCVADLGDLDGDGWPEIGVGIPMRYGPSVRGADERGAVRIFSSRTGAVLRDVRCPRERYRFGAAIAVRAARAGEDGPVLIVASAPRVESSAPGDTPELYEFSARTWEPIRVRSLEGRGGQRLVVLRGTDGSQRIATSRCDCDTSGAPGAVTIFSDDPSVSPLIVTRATLTAHNSVK